MTSGIAAPDPASGAAEEREPPRHAAVPRWGSSVALAEALAEMARLRRPARGARAPGLVLDDFLGERSPAAALRLWTGQFWTGAAVGGDAAKRRLLLALSRDIAAIDEVVSRQVNAVIHHAAFQRLEASWCSLRHLVEESAAAENVKIKMLNVSWRELAKDAERAVEFDQSQLFRKVYSGEFDMPGGEPFGMLIGDYEIRHRSSPSHPVDDVDVLTKISQTAAAAFAPFVAGAGPGLFGLRTFVQLERPGNLPRLFQHPEYLRWRAFRDTEDARFVALTVPRVLVRLPYEDDGSRDDGFRFREDVDGVDHSKYLWGSAAFAFGAVVLRAFSESGWLAGIRGVHRDELGGGLVTGLPSPSFATDTSGVATKGSTDLVISDHQEKELADLGFIPLCPCKDTEFSAFYSNQSVKKPEVYDKNVATVNAKISSMLQYTLCASRFAHYLKVRTQQKIGSFASARDIEDDLNRWINDYVAPDPDAAPDVKARFPLREAQIRIRERHETPGNYDCVMHLLPHYQLDSVSGAVTLRTELRSTKKR